MSCKKLRAVILFLSFYPALAFAASMTRVETLVSPIALYPDPLLQAILPASTFPDQIADAALLIRSKDDANQIAQQSWDPSVKVIATYPGVLKMMYEKLDWTTQLGQVFLADNEQVMQAIQSLRGRAAKAGNLKSSPEQQVTTESTGGTTIVEIQPSDPQVVYVPQYVGETVYAQPVASTTDYLAPVVTFGLGMALGSALSDDDDHYYGGPWGGGGIWHSDDHVDHWMDNRRAAAEDFHDRASDRQNFRQDQARDRQDYRQQWAKDHPGSVNKENLSKARDQAKTRADSARGRAQEKRASYTGRSASSSSYSRPQRSSAFSSGNYSAARSSARGSYSTSRFSSGGGGRMARGGGGGFRGGGGRRR